MSDANSKSTKLVNEEMLRAFAQGQLDEATEDEIVALLDKNPELQAKVAAISIAPVMDKMRAHSQVIGARSLSSQVGGETIIPAAGISNSEFDLPNELSALSEYRIIRELGRGGMGVVYLAHNKYTDRREVLKVLNEQLIEHSEAKERFLQEIKVTARLDHPCIVKALGVREVGKTLAFCMEFIKGRDLHGFISEHGKLPVHLACRIAIDISLALQHAMNQGVLHRDIKPSNVMLCKDENGKARAKVLDFGLGRIGDHEESNGLTEFGSLLGTLEYISPEQSMNAANVDIRADIYSLGCTLYHMLVGHPPFSGTKGELILAHSRDLPPAVNLIQPTVPRELGGIVSRMLAKQADRRYQRPQEIADALQPFTVRKEKQPKPKAPPSTDGPAQAIKHDTAAEVPAVNRTQSAPANAVVASSPDHELPEISVAPQSVLEKGRRPKRTKPSIWNGNRRWVAIGIAATLLLVIALTSVLKIRTSTGTIVFENLPEDAEVLVDGDRVDVVWDAGKATIVVKKGNHDLMIQFGQTSHQRQITISQNERVIRLNELGDDDAAVSTAEKILSGFGDDRSNASMPALPDHAFRQLLDDANTSHMWHVPVRTTDYEIAAGELTVQGNERVLSPLLTTEVFEDFHLKMDLHISGANSGRVPHLLLRASASDKGISYYDFSVGGRKYTGDSRMAGELLCRLEHFQEPSDYLSVPGDDRQFDFSGSTKSPITRDEWHAVEIVSVQGLHTLVVDGRRISTVTDRNNNLPRGAVGFAVPVDQTLRVRNLRIAEVGSVSLSSGDTFLGRRTHTVDHIERPAHEVRISVTNVEADSFSGTMIVYGDLGPREFMIDGTVFGNSIQFHAVKSDSKFDQLYSGELYGDLLQLTFSGIPSVGEEVTGKLTAYRTR